MNAGRTAAVSPGFAATLELLIQSGVDWPELEARLEQPLRESGDDWQSNAPGDRASSPTRVARGLMSRIRQLPPEIKARLDELLRSGVSQTEILHRLEEPLREIGERPLSASGLSRYAREMEAVGRDLRETRAMADAWTANLGERPTGNVSALTIQILQTVALRAARRAWATDEETDAGVDSGLIGELALAVQRLERSASLSLARERELRKEFAAEAAEVAAQSAEKAARESGHALPVEKLEQIRRDVYGIRDAA